MDPVQLWTLIFIVLTFAIYIGIAWRSRVKETSGFYVASQGIPTIANGAAVAADWMSAASFISMAGLIAFLGYDGAIYLMGWTGGYVLLALLLAPYLRKFGKFTVPEFVGDRYSGGVRTIAAVAAMFISFVYVVGQMNGGGIVFSRFLGLPLAGGIAVAMTIIFVYAVLGGMKGITWTQVAQYTVLITAYLIPAAAIAQAFTGFPIPQVTFGQVLQELNALQTELGFNAYIEPFTNRPRQDIFLVTAALMIGTAGLPHVIIRFYTTRSVRGARYSAFWALFFIALLYTTAPAVGVFSKFNLLDQVAGDPYDAQEPWFYSWESTGLITHDDLDGDGIIDFTGDDATNELTVNNDIMVLANPEIAGLPAPIVGLVAAGGMAAAMSTAAGLLLVISSSASHDIYFRKFRPGASEREQLTVGRIAMGIGVLVAGFVGLNPPGFVAQVVAFAFGLAASSFFPVIVLGIFWKRCNAKGAAAGMVTGMLFTAAYMLWTIPIYGGADHVLGISPEGIGTIGALLNFIVTIAVSKATAPPPPEMRAFIEELRYPQARRLPAAAGVVRGDTPPDDVEQTELGGA